MSLPDLSDLYPDQLKVSNLELKAYGAKPSLVGKVETVFCSDDNSKVKEVLSRKGDNRILVIDASGIRHESMVGDQIAKMAIQNDWQGIITNGFIIDVDAINDLPFLILARGSVFKKTTKIGLGKIGVMISFGGLIIRPNDWIYADSNGWGVSETYLKP